MISSTRSAVAAALILSASTLALSGCADITDPGMLYLPTEVTCVNLTEPLSFTAKYGLLDIPSTVRLERGPYVSEHTDGKGTFYRAPPGGLSVSVNDTTAMTLDGGFYVPRDPAAPLKLYKYFSTTPAPVEVPPDGADCSNVGYVRPPNTTRLNFFAMGAAGATGGAVGGVIGRSVAHRPALTYGQSAGAGAAGGLIGGLIVAAMINSEVGKIEDGPEIKDAQFMERLRSLAAARVPVKQVEQPLVPQPPPAPDAPPAAVPPPAGK